ncbi:hypothetical protein [Congregibacter litoralis]|uniref:Uncharacterized protein n=1 Tax=Congregibacter litoralis KT71 TaxID=314285 RepID=V7HT02_9GAMM|nr:hypothetical protein [Congregibacter litoralis]ESZ89361.1 hypothetical protein KT71_003348 [Congregibacter litoralis KT71]
MARYLRDKQIRNITIDASALRQIFQAFAVNGSRMPEYLASDPENRDGALAVTIRFDEKGYRTFDLESLLRYFNDAKDVERVIFEVFTGDSLRTNRQTGSYADLRLDRSDNVSCFLTVSSDDESWMQGTFAAIDDAIYQHKNRNVGSVGFRRVHRLNMPPDCGGAA